jgi:G protein-coupled receptor 158
MMCSLQVAAYFVANDCIATPGNCYDQQEYGAYNLFCPYAYRLPNGSILAKDLAAEYDYLAPSSTWFYNARRRAEEIIQMNTPILRGGPSPVYLLLGESLPPK